MGKKWKHDDIEQQLLESIRESDITIYRLSKISGVADPQIYNFVNGHRSLTLPAAAKLARALGLKLTKEKGRRNYGKYI